MSLPDSTTDEQLVMLAVTKAVDGFIPDPSESREESTLRLAREACGHLVALMHPLMQRISDAAKRAQTAAFEAGVNTAKKSTIKQGWCCPFHELGGAAFTRCGPLTSAGGGNN